MKTTQVGKIIRSKRKTLYLEVASDATLIVRAPLHCSDTFIQEAVAGHLDWIYRRQKYIREHCKPAVPKKYKAGEDFLYLGQLYKLSIIESSNAPLSFDGQQFLIGINRLKDAKELFKSWYKQAAKQTFKERVELASARTGILYQKISINQAKTRWGSCCGAKGKMNFTYRLIMAPLEVIDSVVMHELVHIKVRNHSKEFWSKLNEFVTNYKKYHKWLKENQNLLSL